MRHFTLTNYLAASLATSPADSLNSLHSSQGTARVQKLGSAVMRAPIVGSSMSTPSPVSASTDEPSTRRSALQSILFGGTVAFMAPMGALALDMDAFANSQVRHFFYFYGAVVHVAQLVKHVQRINSLTLFLIHSLFQLENDTKNCDPKKDPKCIPTLDADQALCKYGQSGNARGEACKRAKEAKAAMEAQK
jgi:hypothetical protein